MVLLTEFLHCFRTNIWLVASAALDGVQAFITAGGSFGRLGLHNSALADPVRHPVGAVSKFRGQDEVSNVVVSCAPFPLLPRAQLFDERTTGLRVSIFEVMRGSPSTVIRERLSLRQAIAATLGWVAFFYLLDVCFWGQGVVALVALVAAARQPFAKIPKIRLKLARVALWLALIPAVWGSIYAQNQVAKNRATTVAQAVEAYRSAVGTFPDDLEALVPNYLPSVPRAKPMRFIMGDFDYYRGRAPDDGAVLTYTVFPPFARRYYDFEKKKWSFMD